MPEKKRLLKEQEESAANVIKVENQVKSAEQMENLEKVENLSQPANVVDVNTLESADNPLLATAITPVDKKLYKATTKNLDLLAIILLAVAILLIGILIFNVILTKKFDYIFAIAIVGVLAVAIWLFILKVNLKKSFNKGIVNDYKFYKNCILLTSYTNGNQTGNTKLSYSNIIRRKYLHIFQDAGYLVLYYQTKYTPIYIDLSQTPLAEIEQLQQIFKIKLLK